MTNPMDAIIYLTFIIMICLLAFVITMVAIDVYKWLGRVFNKIKEWIINEKLC
jgi:hypothetical protein